MSSPTTELLRLVRAAAHPPGGAAPTDGQLVEAFVGGDPAAVEALVRRHGPMVWGVCRRVLGRHHDAEDAFQATFLVLVRRAGSIRPRDGVGPWLHGVAHRTALKARAARAKREGWTGPMADVPALPAPADDLRDLIDRELGRLPAHNRAVVVLCDLEGATRVEAAHRLGLPEGTVASRVARGRALLAKRLARHAPGVATLAVPVVVPSQVLAAAIRLATDPAVGVASAEVMTLSSEVIRTMFFTKLKVGTVVLVLAAVAAGGTRLALTAGAANDPPAGSPKAVRPAPPASGLPVGKWRVEFANGVVETCDIGNGGEFNVFNVEEPRRRAHGVAEAKGGAVVLTSHDDRVERWTPVGKRYVVEHWFPASQLPIATPVLGIAEPAVAPGR